MGGKIINRNSELWHSKIKDGFKLKHDKMTPEEVEQIRELRAEGMTYKDIAILMDCSQSCVRSWCVSEEERQAILAMQKESGKDWYEKHKENYCKYKLARLKKLDERGGLIKGYKFRSEMYLKKEKAEELAKACRSNVVGLDTIPDEILRDVIDYAYGQGNMEGYSEGFEDGITAVKKNLKQWIKEQ